MKFCPECGSPIVAQARFCVSCGQPFDPSPPAATQSRSITRLSTGFLTIFAIILLLGAGAGVFVWHRQNHNPDAQQPAANSGEKLPPGHPSIELPVQARQFVSNLEAQAKKDPGNIALWNRLGTVASRAALFDQSYYRMALQAYGHVLQLAPDNLEALKGVGNINYDRQKYDEAVAAYEHYLKLKPDDPEVQSDLGTMYLYTGNADQAIVRYKKAISIKPDFFEGYFNMGIAYGASNNQSAARTSFEQALKLAPDKDTRDKVTEMLARVSGSVPGGPRSPSKGQVNATAATDNNFEGRIEAMVRGLPFAGPKVQAFRWDSKTKAVVMMDNFPMDAMPPFARQKFLGDLSAGIEDAKEKYHVSGTFQLSIADASTGHVMESISK